MDALRTEVYFPPNHPYLSTESAARTLMKAFVVVCGISATNDVRREFSSVYGFDQEFAAIVGAAHKTLDALIVRLAEGNDGFRQAALASGEELFSTQARHIQRLSEELF